MGLIRKLVLWPIFLFCLLVGLILWKGGDKIRWFGKKTAETGTAIQKKTEAIGQTSDRIKETFDDQTKSINQKIDQVVEKAEKRGILKREPENGTP